MWNETREIALRYAATLENYGDVNNLLKAARIIEQYLIGDEHVRSK